MKASAPNLLWVGSQVAAREEAQAGVREGRPRLAGRGVRRSGPGWPAPAGRSRVPPIRKLPSAISRLGLQGRLLGAAGLSEGHGRASSSGPAPTGAGSSGRLATGSRSGSAGRWAFCSSEATGGRSRPGWRCLLAGGQDEVEEPLEGLALGLVALLGVDDDPGRRGDRVGVGSRSVDRVVGQVGVDGGGGDRPPRRRPGSGAWALPAAFLIEAKLQAARLGVGVVDVADRPWVDLMAWATPPLPLPEAAWPPAS